MTETLILGDCVEIMRGMESESVDMIFADPPFNVGKKYAGKASNDKRADYYYWCAEWIAEGFRLLKPTGTFYLMTIARHIFRMGCEMEKHGVFINKVEWHNVAGAYNKRGFWSATQSIAVFGKTENYIFNTYAQKRKIAKENLRWGGYTTEAKGQLLDYWNDIPFVYAGSISHPEAIIKKGTNEKAHPAQMPVNLAARCILFSTHEGATVLDPFNGSGSSGAACIKTKRNYIGIEKESEYIELSKQRFLELNNQPALF